VSLKSYSLRAPPFFSFCDQRCTCFFPAWQEFLLLFNLESFSSLPLRNSPPAPFCPSLCLRFSESPLGAMSFFFSGLQYAIRLGLSILCAILSFLDVYNLTPENSVTLATGRSGNLIQSPRRRFRSRLSSPKMLRCQRTDMIDPLGFCLKKILSSLSLRSPSGLISPFFPLLLFRGCCVFHGCHGTNLFSSGVFNRPNCFSFQRMHPRASMYSLLSCGVSNHGLRPSFLLAVYPRPDQTN